MVRGITFRSRSAAPRSDGARRKDGVAHRAGARNESRLDGRERIGRDASSRRLPWGGSHPCRAARHRPAPGRGAGGRHRAAKVSIALDEDRRRGRRGEHGACLPNPVLIAGYSNRAPQYHFSLDQPIEYPWLRSARADAAADSAAPQPTVSPRASAAELEADVAYTMMLATRARALSHRTTVHADPSRPRSRARRGGDASELEVELAMVSAAKPPT